MVHFSVFAAEIIAGATYRGGLTCQLVAWSGGEDPPIFADDPTQLAQALFSKTMTLHPTNDHVTIGYKPPWELWSFNDHVRLWLYKVVPLAPHQIEEFTRVLHGLYSQEICHRTHGRPV